MKIYLAAPWIVFTFCALCNIYLDWNASEMVANPDMLAWGKLKKKGWKKNEQIHCTLISIAIMQLTRWPVEIFGAYPLIGIAIRWGWMHRAKTTINIYQRRYNKTIWFYSHIVFGWNHRNFLWQKHCNWTSVSENWKRTHPVSHLWWTRIHKSDCKIKADNVIFFV